MKYIISREFEAYAFSTHHVVTIIACAEADVVICSLVV